MSKLIPCGLLAVAVSSALLVAQEGNKPMAEGWSSKPGKGLTFNGGNDFELKWSNYLQVHWTYTGNEPYGSAAAGLGSTDTNTFTIRRARTNLTGHVFSKNIQYRFVYEAVDAGSAGDGNIKDGWVLWNFLSSDDGAIGLRVGQSKVQFGLEATTSATGLWFVERSSASRAFADSRSRGAWLDGVMASHRLRWVAGAMNTDVAAGLGGAGTDPHGLSITGYADRGEESNNPDNQLSYVLAANFDPFGDFFDEKQTIESMRQGDFRTGEAPLKGTVGVGVALGNGRTASSVSGAIRDVESTTINLNTAWTFNNVNLLAEYYMRTDELQGPVRDKEEPTGWTVGLGYLLPKSGDSMMQWGLGVRFNRNESDEGTSGSGVDFLTGMQGLGAEAGSCNEITAVLNAFYRGHACKSQLEYTYQDVNADAANFDRTNHIVRIGFQLMF